MGWGGFEEDVILLQGARENEQKCSINSPAVYTTGQASDARRFTILLYIDMIRKVENRRKRTSREEALHFLMNTSWDSIRIYDVPLSKATSLALKSSHKKMRFSIP